MTPSFQSQCEELKRLAEAATTFGPECPEKLFIFNGNGHGIIADIRYDHDKGEAQSERNYDYFRAANPAVVIQILNEREELLRRLARAEEVLEAIQDGDYSLSADTKIIDGLWAAAAREALAELRAPMNTEGR